MLTEKIAVKTKAKSKNVNLLPREFRYGFFRRIIFYQESHPKQFIIWTASGLIVIAFAISIYQTALAKSYLKQSTELESEIHKLQAKHKEAEGVMDRLGQTKQMLGFQISLIEKRIAFLKSQYRFGHHWGMTFKELMRILPEGVWLIGVKTEKGQLKIKGGALKQELVSDFMTILRSSPAFSNITFDYTQDSRVGRTEVVLFELTCNSSL